MSDYEIKATVLGFDPKYGELIAASAAKEVIAHFQEQLAKANKRVAELESELDLKDVKIIDLQHQVGTLEFNRVTSKDLNKFAIEQQIKGVENAIAHAPSKEKYALPLVDTTDLYDYCEQLRKEQGSD